MKAEAKLNNGIVKFIFDDKSSYTIKYNERNKSLVIQKVGPITSEGLTIYPVVSNVIEIK